MPEPTYYRSLADFCERRARERQLAACAPRPLMVDDAGNGLYETPTGRAFVDFECAEERWIMDQVREQEAEYDHAAHLAEMALQRIRQEERDRWEPDDEHPWREHEEPMGLMFGVEDRRAM